MCVWVSGGVGAAAEGEARSSKWPPPHPPSLSFHTMIIVCTAEIKGRGTERSGQLMKNKTKQCDNRAHDQTPSPLLLCCCSAWILKRLFPFSFLFFSFFNYAAELLHHYRRDYVPLDWGYFPPVDWFRITINRVFLPSAFDATHIQWLGLIFIHLRLILNCLLWSR